MIHFIYKFAAQCLILVFFTVKCFSQNQISGKVTDGKTGNALEGATIEVMETTLSALTDKDGMFTLTLPSANRKIKASYIGYKDTIVSITAGQNFVHITLNFVATELEDVVVVGFGTQKKQTVTGAISSITTKELVQSPVANISNSLAGRFPGLSALQRSGEPGLDASSIKIRGIGSLSSGTESDPLILIDGIPRDNMNQIDPNEIASLTILKDASATAVYGVRGANGVILVTTRQGQRGKTTVSASSNIAIQSPTQLPDFLGSYEHALLRNESAINDGMAPYFSNEVLEKFRNNSDPILYPNNDWVGLLVKDNALQQQHNVNISGGSKGVRYFISTGYFNQQGNYNTGDFDYGYDPTPRYNRYNFRSNIDIDFTKKLSGAIRVASQYGRRNFAPQGASDLFFNALNTPYSGPGVIDGKLVTSYINDPLGGSSIPTRGYSVFSDVLDNGYGVQLISNMNLNFTLNYDLSSLINGLSIKGTYAYDNTYTRLSYRVKAIDIYSVLVNNDGSYQLIKNNDAGNFSSSQGTSQSYRKNYVEFSVNYNRRFNSHHFTGLILYNQSKEYDAGYQYNVPRTILGLAGRVTYSYQGKYLAEINAGYNGSENFPDNKRFGFFPAYSLGWIVSDEKFFPKVNSINFLKIRGSYGEVGNDKIGGDRFLYLPDTYTFLTGATNGYYFGTYGVARNRYNGSRENKIGNPNVTWERALKTNIGVELIMFNRQLNITGDFFIEKRNNILVNLGTIPALVAANLPAANVGEVKNKGYEVEVKWAQSINNQLSYYISANIAYTKNRILYRDEPTPPYYWMAQTGFSVGQLKGYRTNGLYNTRAEVSNRPFYSFAGNAIQRGDLKYVDIDGDGIIDQNDIVPVGYSNEIPEYSGGISAGLNYKGFDFSVLFSGVTNFSGLFIDGWGNAYIPLWRQTLSKFMERWNEERYEKGATINYPRLSNTLTTNPNAQNSDFLAVDMSYIRLKNIEIGYTVNTSLSRKKGIERIRFYVNGNNLFLWSGFKDMDPDATDGSRMLYPPMRVINCGLNVQF